MIRGILVLCVAIGLYKTWGYWEAHHSIGKVVHFEVPMVDGQAVSIETQRGNVVVVMYWASWCAPCRQEMPTMEEYYQRHRHEGLVVLAVNSDDSESRAQATEMMKAYSFRHGFLKGMKGDRLGFSGPIPRTAVIDRDGILRTTWDGAFAPPSAEMAYLEQTITPLLHGTH